MLKYTPHRIHFNLLDIINLWIESIFLFFHYNYRKHKSYYQYHILDNYSGFSSYDKIIDSFLKLPIIDTSEQISCLGIGLDFSKRKLIQKLGFPRRRLSVSKKERLDIYCYRKRFGKERVKLEFHLYKNRVFFINVRFSSITNNDKTIILEVLKRKYGASNSGLESKVYKNFKEHILYIRDELNFNLIYFSLASEFYKRLNEKKHLEAIYSNGLKYRRIRHYYQNL